MADVRLLQWKGVSKFQSVGTAWDDLWRRSKTTMPTVRSEPLTQWIEHFAGDACVWGTAVADRERLLAGLMLVENSLARFA